MRIEYMYENRYLIPKEHEENFYPYRKKSLSTIEHIGLEAIALEFLCAYEEEMMGCPVSAERRQELRDVLRWCEDNIDILDGCYDTYEFDGYLFSEVWCTDNGIPMLTAWEIPEDCEDWTEHEFNCEFEARIFRLN